MCWASLKGLYNIYKRAPTTPLLQRGQAQPFFTDKSWNSNNLRGKSGSLEVISSSGIFTSKMHGPYFLIAPIHPPFSCYRWLEVPQGEEGSGGSFSSFTSLCNQYFSAVEAFLSLLSLATPAASECSLGRSKLLSARLDLRCSLARFAGAEAEKIGKGR